MSACSLEYSVRSLVTMLSSLCPTDGILLRHSSDNNGSITDHRTNPINGDGVRVRGFWDLNRKCSSLVSINIVCTNIYSGVVDNQCDTNVSNCRGGQELLTVLKELCLPKREHNK